MLLSTKTAPLYSPSILGWQWMNLDPRLGFIAAVGLMLAIAVLDYVTGYELRFGILYLIPIAVAAWTGGRNIGFLISSASSLFWLLGFRSVSLYPRQVHSLWEAAVMLFFFTVFVILLIRLRTALTQADERFLRVLEEMAAGICVIDQQSGAMLYANWRLKKMMASDPLSMSAAEFESYFIGSTAAEHAPLLVEVETGSHFSSREARNKKTGRWYIIHSGHIPWEPGQRAELKVITDITEQKQAQALKRKHQEILNITARRAALAEIASTVSHEINQPLMAIASYNDACLRLLSSPDYKKEEVISALQKCRKQAMRAGHIIVRMREFIRRRHPTPAQFDMNAMLSEAVELTQFHWEDAGVSVKLILSDALPSVFADRTLLLQVAINLIQNAIDAMRACPLTERKLIIATDIKTDSIVVSVQDQGEGISEADLSELYTPFFTTKPQGLGLGLSICKSVVEVHGGRLWVTQNTDAGCTFHFTVPAEI